MPNRFAVDARLGILLAIGLAAAITSTWIIRRLPAVQSFELLAYDWHSAALSPVAADPRIVIVAMDDDSLSRLPLARASYPLPRSFHARLLHELHEGGAKVVGFDIMFTQPVPEEDAPLAEAMKEQGNVLCGAEPKTVVSGGEELFQFTDPDPALRPFVRACSLAASRRFGRVRWFLPSTVDEQSGKRYMHISVALAAAYNGASGDGVLHETFDIGETQIPVGGEGEMLIRFAGPDGTFKPIPYAEVYTGDWRRTHGADFFKDKIVIVGAYNRFTDRHNTPAGEMQGVEVLANATQMVLNSDWIVHWSETANLFARLALVSGLAFAVWSLGIRRAALIFLFEAVVWIVLAREAFVREQVWIDTVEPVGVLAFSLLLSTTYEAARMRRVFKRFMPSSIADQMLESSPDAAIETAEKEVTIVFCDVRDSTRLGETLPPATVEELLRRYFIAGEEAALRLGTELDKFVGDEIMLFFEQRDGYEDHAIRGIRWALAIQDAALEITKSGLAGDIGFRVGSGVCTGRVRIGLVGAKQRIQHTVVGDAVNTASRLQTATKEVNRGIVVGESTWQRAKGRFKGEELGEIQVKGKRDAMRIYCPLGTID